MCEQPDEQYLVEEVISEYRMEQILQELVGLCYDFLDLVREIGILDEVSEAEMISGIQEDSENNADNE